MVIPVYPIPGSPNSTDGLNNNPNPISNTGAETLIGPAPGSLTGPSVGSRSNVTGWLPDAMTMMQEAAEHAGTDLTTGYTLRSFKRSMEYMAMLWSNFGLNLWLLEEMSTALTPGVAKYLMPADTIDLISAGIQTQIGMMPDGSPRYELILVAREDFDTYFSYPQKQTPGKPTTIFVQRSIPQPQFFVWPVPNTYQPYTLIWWRLRRMQNLSYATNLVDIPFRLVPAFTFGLAWQVAIKKKGPKDFNLIAMLKANYDEALQRGLNEDRDRSSLYISPMIGWS